MAIRRKLEFASGAGEKRRLRQLVVVEKNIYIAWPFAEHQGGLCMGASPLNAGRGSGGREAARRSFSHAPEESGHHASRIAGLTPSPATSAEHRQLERPEGVALCPVLPAATLWLGSTPR